MRFSFSTAVLLFQASLATAGNLQCASPGNQYGSVWTQDAWDDFWNIRNDICSSLQTAKSQPFEMTVKGWAGTVQMKLQAGMTSQHCYDATKDIINGCFSSSDVSPSGTWSTDSNNKEWYWFWVDASKKNRRWQA